MVYQDEYGDYVYQDEFQDTKLAKKISDKPQSAEKSLANREGRGAVDVSRSGGELRAR